jgi:3-oxoacyl-[acyl-carrier-protein] synthase II
MRRVVVTGTGNGHAAGLRGRGDLVAASGRRIGRGPITRFDASHLATTYACEIPRGDGSDGTFNPDDWMEPKERRKVDDFILYGMAAAQQAVEDAGWLPEDEEGRLRTGVMIGSGIGGLSTIAETARC